MVWFLWKLFGVVLKDMITPTSFVASQSEASEIDNTSSSGKGGLELNLLGLRDAESELNIDELREAPYSYQITCTSSSTFFNARAIIPFRLYHFWSARASASFPCMIVLGVFISAEMTTLFLYRCPKQTQGSQTSKICAEAGNS